jgi:hypothetical protein
MTQEQVLESFAEFDTNLHLIDEVRHLRLFGVLMYTNNHHSDNDDGIINNNINNNKNNTPLQQTMHTSLR